LAAGGIRVSDTTAGIVEGPPLAVAIPSTTVRRFIREHARRRPGAVALVDAASGRGFTYGALDHLIGRFAAGLAARGFGPGDTLLMFAPNAPEWPIASLAPEDVKSWRAERVVAYKQLGDVVLCDAIPKIAAGKILRRVLRVQDAARGASV
jgi:acyl-CoA synthetase (AMP-forming)/AMP-acid ligase II